MPEPGEPADVVLIDTTRGNQVEVIDQSRGWNPQQGTMFTGFQPRLRTGLLRRSRPADTEDLHRAVRRRGARRVRGYRFDETPVANGGVAQNGGRFLAIDYGISRG